MVPGGRSICWVVVIGLLLFDVCRGEQFDSRASADERITHFGGVFDDGEGSVESRKLLRQFGMQRRPCECGVESTMNRMIWNCEAGEHCCDELQTVVPRASDLRKCCQRMVCLSFDAWNALDILETCYNGEWNCGN
ncbi:hypothetical protein BSKO_10501 [Bryopsis sp. KO-2023]|nr:hypothetical protein BSKO_10501 [Bryopsis sp. KO-2023]